MAVDPPESPEIFLLREEADRKRSRLEAMKIAFYNRTTFDGEVPDEGRLHEVARDFIKAHYELQKKLWGKIRAKLSVANLLR